MTLLFSNNAQTTIAGSITNIATSVALAPGSGVEFPTPGAGQTFVGTFNDAATGLLYEIVSVTARSTDTLTIVRAQESTTALSWNAGDIFGNFMTAGTAQAFLQAALVGGEQAFTTTGTFTPGVNVTRVKCRMWGAGGGGGYGGGSNGGCGGGGAGYAEGYFTVVPGVGLTVTCGTPGSGGVFGTTTPATAGGTTSVVFGSGTLQVTGGGLGQSSGGTPGAAGIGSGGTTNLNLTGNIGNTNGSLGAGAYGGNGGSAPFNGNTAGDPATVAGAAGFFPGGGGNGGGLSANGGAGASPLVIFEW
jgi:hypothetical protein